MCVAGPGPEGEQSRRGNRKRKAFRKGGWETSDIVGRRLGENGTEMPSRGGTKPPRSAKIVRDERDGLNSTQLGPRFARRRGSSGVRRSYGRHANASLPGAVLGVVPSPTRPHVWRGAHLWPYLHARWMVWAGCLADTSAGVERSQVAGHRHQRQCGYKMAWTPTQRL